MSCWVVPALAAELWRMPLEQVMKLVRDGAVPTKQDEGFTFIDVAPLSPKIDSPSLKPGHRPPTFIPAADDADVDLVIRPEEGWDEDAGSDATESYKFGDWRSARAKVSITRIGPPLRRKSA
jgi:hypothetical protein